MQQARGLEKSVGHSTMEGELCAIHWKKKKKRRQTFALVWFFSEEEEEKEENSPLISFYFVFIHISCFFPFIFALICIFRQDLIYFTIINNTIIAFKSISCFHFVFISLRSSLRLFCLVAGLSSVKHFELHQPA